MQSNRSLLTLSLAVFLSGANTPSLAAEDPKAEALREAETAHESRMKGDMAAAAAHAEAAKGQAESAQRQRANPHLEAAIKNLDQAVSECRVGHEAACEEATFGALTHLKAAEKSF